MDEKEIEILNESIGLLERIRFSMEADGGFVGPGATARFNGYETLTGAIVYLRKRRSGLEWNALTES